MSRQYHLAICQDCTPKLPMPFDEATERDEWAKAHHEYTGHTVEPELQVVLEADTTAFQQWTEQQKTREVMVLTGNLVIPLPPPELRSHYNVGEHRIVRAFTGDEPEPKWLCFDHGETCFATTACREFGDREKT